MHGAVNCAGGKSEKGLSKFFGVRDEIDMNKFMDLKNMANMIYGIYKSLILSHFYFKTTSGL